MTPRELEPGLFVSAQIQPGDIAVLKARGFRSLICNRPDHEEPDQPDSANMAQCAHEAGLAWASIPVTAASLDEHDVQAYAKALQQMPRPILAYCRSGNRCCVLWGLARAADTPPDDLAKRAAEAGYDLSAWMPRMRARAAAG